jgi:hypothetical protein
MNPPLLMTTFTTDEVLNGSVLSIYNVSEANGGLGPVFHIGKRVTTVPIKISNSSANTFLNDGMCDPVLMQPQSFELFFNQTTIPATTSRPRKRPATRSRPNPSVGAPVSQPAYDVEPA